jgi:hypothetical protein
MRSNRRSGEEGLARPTVELSDAFSNAIGYAANGRARARAKGAQLRRSHWPDFEADYPPPGRRYPELARKLNSSDDIEIVRRHETRFATIQFVETEFVNDSGRVSGAYCVNEDRGLGAVEQIHERGAGPIGGDHFAIRRRRIRQDARDFQPDGIVAKRTANPDYSNQRSISSLRKWVEHEMHGS